MKYCVLIFIGCPAGLFYFNTMLYFFKEDWRLLTLFTNILIYAICLILCWFFIVESPSYVAQFNQRESIKLLNQIAKSNGS